MSDTPVEAPLPSVPLVPAPPGACDTHTHVFGPYARFPFAQPPSYAPPLAPLAAHSEMRARVGLARAVLVQPAPYATDPAALLDALRHGHGALRGVAVADPSVDDETLQVWHGAGVRGLRFNEVPDSATGRPFAGSVGLAALPALAPRLRALGWHAQVWARAQDVDAVVGVCGDLGVPLVLEHMASVRIEAGIHGGDFQTVLRHLRAGRAWIKLDVCRVSRAVPAYDEVRPFHDALVDANPARLLWASDWPFVRLGSQAPDVGCLLDLLAAWVPDAAIRRRLLVDNPHALYVFEDAHA